MKKANRKLIPAVAMLLISAIMLSTSSFAWFSINTSVKATGMSVNATADTSLLIKGSDRNQTFGAVGTSTVANATMKPCTSKDGVKFGKLASGVKVLAPDNSDATWSGSLGKFAPADLEEAKGTGFIAPATYQIKTVGGNLDVYVESITVSTLGDKLGKAIRVSVQLGEGTVYVYNAGGGSSDTVGYYDTSAWTLVAPTYTQVGEGQVIGRATNTPQDVKVQVWFEGQDTNCFSDNIETGSYAVDIVFGSKTPT